MTTEKAYTGVVMAVRACRSTWDLLLKRAKEINVDVGSILFSYFFQDHPEVPHMFTRNLEETADKFFKVSAGTHVPVPPYAHAWCMQTDLCTCSVCPGGNVAVIEICGHQYLRRLASKICLITAGLGNSDW
jgi:hypothetical protein